MAIDQTAEVLKAALPAFEREWDLELVAQAMPANIKMMEGLLVSSPDSQPLLFVLAKAYSAYALVVLEDRYELARDAAGIDADDSKLVQRLRLRLREMYLRGHRYGLRAMDRRRPGFARAFAKGREPLAKALTRCTEADVPALFWATMPLGSAINVGRDDVQLIAEIPKVRKTMERLVELDETYYNGGPHLVLGSLFGGVGPMLGGNPKRARQHFERALKLTKRRFLLVQEMYARTLAVQLQDAKLFRRLLAEVQKADLAAFPAQMLANVAAKRRARRTLKRIDELF